MTNGQPKVIVNTSKAIELADRAQVARSLWGRMKGLLGRASLSEGEGLVIPGCASIHTCFMRFPIDALFIDRDFRVVKVVHGLPPFRFTAPARSAWGVIELPSGTAQRSQTTVGDVLRCDAEEPEAGRAV